MKKYYFVALALLYTISTKAQILTPVHWSYASKRISATEAVIFLRATINEGWHMYSQHVKNGGPVKTSISLIRQNSFKS